MAKRDNFEQGAVVICARVKLGKVVRIEHLQGAKSRNNVAPHYHIKDNEVC